MHVSTMLQFINKYSINKTWFLGEVVVAQLVERSLPNQRSAIRIQSSAKFILNICLLVFYQLYCKDENK